MVLDRVILRRLIGSSGQTIWLINTEHGDELVVPVAKWWLPKGHRTCQVDQIGKLEVSVITPHGAYGLAAVACIIISVIAAVAWSTWLSILVVLLLVLVWALENGTLSLMIQRRATNEWEKYSLCRSSEDRQAALRAAVAEINRYLVWQEAAASVPPM